MTTSSTRTIARITARTTLAVVGAAVLATVVPAGVADAQPPHSIVAAPVGSTLDSDSPTPVRTVVPCFAGRLAWNDALAGPPPHCYLVR